MPAAAVIGAQWGDEGKGKAVDVFSEKADFVVRWQGGANAGHTLKPPGGKEMVLRLTPSGVLRPSVRCVISAGVALDTETLYEEVSALQKGGFLEDKSRLSVSNSATLVLQGHKQLDQAREAQAANGKIGTTGKGIGPAYESRAARRALVFSDLFEPPGKLLEKLESALQETHFLLRRFYNQKPISAEEEQARLLQKQEALRPFRCQDTSFLVSDALQRGNKVLFEGAQGCLLDVLHGTYPYVTSSSTLAGGALAGAGLGPRSIDKALAVIKAYTTRVGSGPFPTECGADTEEGRFLQEKGREFGAVTGRKRRCGRLDLPALKYALRLNSITGLAVMKLDVLSGLKEIKICTGYLLNGQKLSRFPARAEDLNKISPEYKSLPGWTEDLSGAKALQDLPAAARGFLDFISSELKTPVDVISVGPARSQTIWIRPLFPSS